MLESQKRVDRLQRRLATRIRPGLERRIFEVTLWYETEKGVAAIKESVERGAQEGEVGLTPDILELAEDGIRPLRERLGKIREARVPSRPTGTTGEHTRLPYPAEPTPTRPTVPIVTPEPEAVTANYPEIIVQGKRRAVIISETLTIPGHAAS